MEATQRGRKVIEAEQIFDGIGPLIKHRSLIIVEGGTIRSIGSADEVEVPLGPDVEHLRVPPGSTLLPGLIDSHTHLTMNGSGIPPVSSVASNEEYLLMQAAVSAYTHLVSGVTTVVDAGAHGSVAFQLVEAAALGLINAPRLIVAGRPITRTGGHAWSMGEEADGPLKVSLAARQLLKEGADFIKIMATGGGTLGTYPHLPSYRQEELVSAVEEAHENGKIAVAHSSATEGHRRCLAAEIDIIYHCHFYDADGRLRFDEDVAKRLADAPVHVNPTLWINGGRVDVLKAKSENEGLSDAEQVTLDLRASRYAGQRENVARMIQHGVKLIAGTDAGFALYPFGDLVTELQEMVTCGMPTTEVLQAATKVAAEALRIDHVVGSLAPGLAADLVVVKGDPTREIGALRDIQAVVLGGTTVRNDGGLVTDVDGLGKRIS